MKTLSRTNTATGVALVQRLFSRVMRALCIPAPATITPQLAPLSGQNRVRPTALLMAGTMLTLVSTALLTPRTADARAAYLDAVVGLNHPTSAQANMCSNCHIIVPGPAYSSRIDYVIYNGLTTNAIPSTNAMYAMDSDQDGRTNLQEIEASKLAGTVRPAQTAASPNVANNWNWQIPDRDGDGCSHYFSRFTEAGTYPATSDVALAAIVGTGDNYRRFNPRGWDMDDNDAAQGCNPTPWTDTAIDVTSGTSTDNLPPGAVNTLSGAAIGSAVIPLKWNAVGDDGNGVPGGTAGGPAHSYELRYTTSAFANGTVGRNPRSPADWEIMHNVAEPDEIDSGLWSVVGDPDSLMQALYEPRPDVPGAFQPCNALNTTCTAGASYDIKARGTNLAVNVIVNGTTYWVALWTHDGVTRITGTLTTPETVTEQATLSNIIAVTAGPAGTGAAISSISPTTLSGAVASIGVTATGFGLNSTQAAQMVLTNSAGTVIASATGLTYTDTTVAGSFASPIADGIYNLELRTTGAVTKAAWVNAMTVSGFTGGTPPPTIITATPNSRGQGATSQIVVITGQYFTGATAVSFGAGITTNSFVINSDTQITANITVAAAATVGTRSVTVTTSAGTNGANTAFSVTAAPVIGSPPPNGTYGVAYSYTCTATGGVPPYTWSMTGLPPGLIFDADNCQVTGTPTMTGTFVGSLTVTDSNGGRSSIGTSIIISAIVPGAPVIGTATAGDAQATVTFSPPTSNGGSQITSYTATSNPDNISGSCTASPCTVTGLANGTAYTFTVTATNSVGNSPASAASNSVTPGATASYVDLVMTAVSTTSTSVGAGHSFVIDNTEQNQGTTDNTVANTVMFYLSIDAVISTSDVVLTGSRVVPELAAGASSSAVTTVTVPTSVVPGSYYIGVIADATNLVLETNETNNARAGGIITVIRNVDLVMSAVSTTSTSVGAGHSFAIDTTERNQGTTNMTAANNTVMFYLSIDALITTSDIVLTGSRVVSALAAGASSTAVTMVTVPTSVVPGTYYVGACADATYVQMETNEANNCSAASTIVVIRDVDLVMTAVSTTTTSVGTGTFFVIDNTETNIGTTNMTAVDNAVTFYLSTDNIITTADIDLVGSRVVTALAAGASSTASTSVFARAATPPGTYYIGACADVADAQVESNEVNNCLAGATIAIVNITTVPGAPTIGMATPGNAQATVTFTPPASNGGSAITSYTATSSPGGITGSCAASPCTVTGLTNGTAYTFTVIATNAVGNSPASAASNSVTPGANASDIDLVMTAVSTTTTSVGTGTMFVIDSTETNIGTANMTAANNIVSFYLSLDNMITTSDIELVASRTVTALPAGASSAGSTSTFARASTPSGTYYLGACADVTNLQPETNETNNCLASAATITIIGSITVPGAPTIGTATAGNASASVTFTAPVNNGGSAITSYTATSTPGGITGTCTVSPCTVTGLTNGTTYTFTVTAINAVGTGAASAPSNSVIPLENVPPSVPTKLTARAFSTTQINLTWNASTDNVGVTGYKVYRNGMQVGAPAGTSYSDTGLTAATSYQYTVAACDAAGNCSAQSAAVTGTTKRK